MKNLKLALIFLFAIGAGPAFSAVWQWSKTASNDATADPSINWSEGQSPSSVNDSARAMMARLAEYRDDISGVLATGGTASAYTVTTNQTLNTPTPTDGQLLSITPHATNAVSATLAADGGTAYAIQTSAGVGVPAGTLVLGSPYTMKFSTTNSAWMLRNFYGTPYSIPLGGLLDYTADTAPNSNFVLPAGQCISRTTYAAYFALVSTRFGACDGVTTFGVPDLRGRGTFAIDNLNGSAANRMTNSANGCGVAFTSVGVVCGGESQTLTTAQLAAHTHVNTLTDAGHTHATGNSNPFVTEGSGGVSYSAGGSSLGKVNTTQSSTSGVTITNVSAGGGTAHPIVPPVMAVTKILRIF